MKYEKMCCPICGNQIGKNNYNRHLSKCDGSYKPVKHTDRYRVTHDGLNCCFCNKLCKSTNSLTQHELRCKNNPNRSESSKRDFKAQYRNLPQETKDRMSWSKGLTSNDSSSVKKCAENRRKPHPFNDVWEEYNSNEINKWLEYVRKFDKSVDSKNYISIANALLSNTLSKENRVHHINLNHDDNTITNLLIFESDADHKRFHNSKYAKLKYNDVTHKFISFVDK